MNPRQRRAVLLLALAAAGLVGVFALVANYVSEVETEVGDKIVVLELTRPAAANEAIPDDAVRVTRSRERWAPGGRADRPHAAHRLVAAADLQPNSILQEGMLAAPPEIRRASARSRSWSTPRPAWPARSSPAATST